MPSIVPVSVQSRRFARAARVAVLVGCGIALAGCTGAIETVRSIRGVNKNDPDPVTAPFSGNLAAAETAPYPNLASVPPPPTRATTAAERRNLTEKLIAERAAAQAIGASAAAQPAARSRAAAQPTPRKHPLRRQFPSRPPPPTRPLRPPSPDSPGAGTRYAGAAASAAHRGGW